MRRALRRKLHSKFKKAVRADQRSIPALAISCGWPDYSPLSTILCADKFKYTPLTMGRLRQLAATVGYAGPLLADGSEIVVIDLTEAGR